MTANTQLKSYTWTLQYMKTIWKLNFCSFARFTSILYQNSRNLPLHAARKYLENGDGCIASCLVVLNENINSKWKKKLTRLCTLQIQCMCVKTEIFCLKKKSQNIHQKCYFQRHFNIFNLFENNLRKSERLTCPLKRFLFLFFFFFCCVWSRKL